MATPKTQTFVPMQHPDPVTNRIIQDLYDKFRQVQLQLEKLQASLPTH